MRTATLLPVVALLAGAVSAAPLPNADASPEPLIWSWDCGLFGWRCRNNTPTPQPTPSAEPSQPPQPSSQAPPQPSSQAPPQPSGSQPPQPSGSQPPQPSGSQPPQPSGSQAPPQPSGPVCLTPEFCPDTGLGQGGDPRPGDGTATFPNGILAPEGDRQRRAEEARLD